MCGRSIPRRPSDASASAEPSTKIESTPPSVGLAKIGGSGSATPAGTVAAEFAYGWLCFETVGEKRRLAPVPEGWDRADDETIEQWCCVAKPATRRKTSELNGKQERAR